MPLSARETELERLDQQAGALKRQARQIKLALQQVRRRQAVLTGIQVNTRPQGGRSVPSPENPGSDRAA